MTAYEIIAHKRDGNILRDPEINFFIREFNAGQIPDYQMAAFLMAIFFQGMNQQETRVLTDAFINSGKIIDLRELPGKKVDKHSTGGVGDKISLILAPIVAAAGVYVPMISGRGLGHTGGTLDKLESIPGFQIDLPVSKFKEILLKTGACLMGQTADIAPVDKKVYALRDVTATVPSIPLIAASIMSKKIAAGIDALVLDIKVGRGAFMRDQDTARQLARSLIQIGEDHGKSTSALLTDMNQPLGYAVGNWIEIRECIQCLQGNGPEDLMQITCRLAGMMLYQAEMVTNIEAGESQAIRIIKEGKAWDKFVQIAEAQGGDTAFLMDPDTYPHPKGIKEVAAKQSGWIQSIDALEIGLTGVGLGAGRMKTSDAIDPKAGILLQVKTGDYIEKTQPLAILYSDKSELLSTAARRAEKAFHVTDKKPAPTPLILEMIIGSDL